ncbi:unnamed protein product [Prorocentrum cordatum]|uniref:F-actin-capping protein subunit alpha n=1 Tax=Prorocentrum cordatum TaxID=2364126 RepID=A0ABN9Y9H5_9DINO|nr:unnamed protein product [Polarella glacialis]
MKFAARCDVLAIRCLLEVLAGPENMINNRATSKGRVEASVLLGRRAAGRITATYTVSTGNIQVQGPAAVLEEAMDNLQALDSIFHHLLTVGTEGVPAVPAGLENVVDGLPEEPYTCYVEAASELEQEDTVSVTSVWKPLQTVPSEEGYTTAIEKIMNEGMEQLKDYPTWREKFVRTMVERFGAALPSSSDWETVSSPGGAYTSQKADDEDMSSGDTRGARTTLRSASRRSAR